MNFRISCSLTIFVRLSIKDNKIRGNSFNNKINSEENISYIYANNKNNNSMITNNLINSYNKECSEEYSLFIQNKFQ